MQSAYVWRGYLDEVSSAEQGATKPENVQHILCARSRCLAVGNNGEHTGLRARSAKDGGLIDKRIQTLGDKTTGIVNAVVERMTARLSNAANDLPTSCPWLAELWELERAVGGRSALCEASAGRRSNHKVGHC